jgi:hypothetical protein
MAPEKLEILISADNKKAIAAIKETILSLDGVEKAAGNTGKGVKKLGTDFTGVSRVIQDLPYGFNAISNNLTNILPAAGMAGLAISALTSAITIAGMGFDNFTSRFFGFRKATEDAKKQTDDFVGILAKEQSQLDLLYKTATDANVPLQARLKAIKDLRSNYGAYLQDFTDEELLANKGTSAYNKLTEAIVKNSRAKAASNMLTQLMEEKLKQENGAIEDKIAAEEKMAMATAWRGQALAAQTSGTQFVKDDIQAVKQQKDATDELNNKLTVRGARIAEINKQMQFLNATIQQNTVAPFTTDDGGGDKVKPKVQSIKEENAELERQIQAYKNLKFAMMGQGTIMPEREKGKDLTNLKLTTQGNSALNQVMLQRNQIEEQRVANLELANNLTNTAMNSLNGLANAMMNGQNIGQALGDMFKRLAIDIALAAAKAAIFQAILSAVSGGTAGAGKGGFLKGFGKLLGFSEGGTVSGPKSGYPVMLHGTEHIVRPDQMRSIIASAAQMGGGNSRVVVEGVVRGNDIWLSQSRTNTFRALTT